MTAKENSAVTSNQISAVSNEAKSMDDFLRGLWKENPVLVQMLGMCPTLAVTNSVANAVAMGLATLFVLCCSSVLVSLLRNAIPREVRIASYIMIIATFVTVAEYAMQAISLELHKSLGAFISLIVVNCIILGRAESFASRNKPWPSFLDALGSGGGFTLGLFAMGTIREILGSGSFYGMDLFGDRFEPWVIFVLPGGGFFVLAFLLIGVNAIKRRAH